MSKEDVSIQNSMTNVHGNLECHVEYGPPSRIAITVAYQVQGRIPAFCGSLVRPINPRSHCRDPNLQANDTSMRCSYVSISVVLRSGQRQYSISNRHSKAHEPKEDISASSAKNSGEMHVLRRQEWTTIIGSLAS